MAKTLSIFTLLFLGIFTPVSATKPNIIFLFADDQNFKSVGLTS